MILYRLTKCAYNNDLSGTGAKLYGGRWNSEGRSMVYFASSRSLSALEALVHLSPTNLPNDYCMMVVETPDSITEIDLKLLPKNWYEYPELNDIKLFGNKFIHENKHLLLKVPSAIVKEEYNYLMNPLHPQATAVKILSSQSFYFDQRLAAV